MPDPNEIVRQIVQFLAPFLPYLLKAGEKAAEEAGRKLGAAAWEQAQALWARLRPKVEARPALKEAVADVAANPQDEDALAALRLQLRKLLEEDPALQEEVRRLMQSEVVQRVLAEGGGQIRDVVQEAEGGPTTQEVQARQSSTVENVRQIRRR
jgi:hypothetical protein